MKSIVIAILVTIAICQRLGDTQITQVDFISNFSLGKQDELNKTFTMINTKLPQIPDVDYKINGTQYWIRNIENPHFFYVDSKQKATIEDQEITITGGYLEVDFKFTWERKNSSGISVNGTGMGFGLSDEIIFSKGLIDDRQNKDLYFNLTEYQNLTFNGGFRVVRVTPETVTDDDLVILRKMLNYIQDQKVVKDYLSQNINSIYSYYLKNYLHDEKFHFNGEFNYTYERRHDASRGKFVVNMTIDLKDVYLDRTGIKYDWKTNITGDNKWKYLDYVINLPFKTNQYGGLQEMVSFTVYQNLARYAMEKGELNSQLNQRNWESRFFQFYCGDLYEVIPKVAQTFYANDPVTGSCNAVPSAFTIQKTTDKTFNVTMQYDCSLKARDRKIIDFNIKLKLEIEGRPQSDKLFFEIVNSYHTVVFSDYMDFKIQNYQLAQMMVKHSMNRIRETDLFGNGWNLLKRDYPHFHVQHDYTLIYDSTHVDSAMTQE